ncbi:DUF2332 domain-containing protein [Pseudoroseicyclus sp. H15]
MSAAPSARLREAFEFQAKSCENLGSPFMARLCTALPGLLPETLIERLESFEGDLSPSGHSVPLRVCGALHALRLQNRAGLAAIYPPHEPADAAFEAGISSALRDEADFIHEFIHSPPQTNEVRRSVALLPAVAWLASRRALPFTLSELGASAGLNLHFVSYAVQTPAGLLGSAGPALTLRPEWRGEAPVIAPVTTVAARGTDLNPLSPVDDRLRLLAYLWPDQPERLELTEAALSLPPSQVDRADAADWLDERLQTPHPGQWHMIYHTIAWQYFPDKVKARAEAAIRAAGAAASAEAPLAWVGMEADQNGAGAGLIARIWPEGEAWQLARVDFHGRWIDWGPRPI